MSGRTLSSPEPSADELKNKSGIQSEYLTAFACKRGFSICALDIYIRIYRVAIPLDNPRHTCPEHVSEHYQMLFVGEDEKGDTFKRKYPRIYYIQAVFSTVFTSAASPS